MMQIVGGTLGNFMKNGRKGWEFLKKFLGK